jgi:hypothetical protein
MIGPRKQKMPDKKICTGCEMLKRMTHGGTKLFPKKLISFYCKHQDLPDGVEVAFINRDKPWTPKWCPAQKGNNGLSTDEEIDDI